MKWLGALHKKDIYIKLFVSYVFILLIPLLFTWMQYLYTASLLTKHAEKNNLNVLEQTREIMDGHIGETEILLTQIASNKKVLQLMYPDNRSQPEILMTYRNLINELAAVSYSENLIASYYIWFRNHGYVVGPTGRFSQKEYFTYHHEGGRYSYEEWIASMENVPPYLGYFDAYSMKQEGVWKDVMDFSLSFPLGTRQSKMGSIHIQLHQNKVKQLLNRVLGPNDGYVCVVTGDGRMVTFVGTEEEEIFDHIPWNEIEQSGYFTRTIDGKEQMVSYTQSLKNGWVYVAVQPLDNILKEAEGLRNLFWMLLFLCLAAGGGLAIGMVYWTTFPIRKISLSLRRYQEEAGSGSWNDFENTVTKLINENTYIRREMEQHRPIVRSTFLTKLIRGKFSGAEEIASNMQELGLVISGFQYTVLLIYISGYRHFISRGILAELEAAKAVIRKMASVTSLLEHALNVDTDEAVLAYIVPFGEITKEQCIRELYLGMEELDDMVGNSNLNLNIAWFWGNIVDGISYIDLAYTQAKHKQERYMMSGEISQADWKDSAGTEEGRYVYAMETEFKLIHLCKEGRIQEISELLNMVKVDNFNDKHLEYSAMALLLDEMKGTIYKLCGIIPMGEEKRQEISSRMEALDSCDFEEVQSMYEQMCNQVKENRRSQESSLNQSMMQYIEENYTDPDFYLVTLAEQFNLSESYLSIFIKDKLGENFTAYLQRLRLTKSCELLKETEETIDGVAALSGYSSAHVYRRAFKRQYGMTPIIYRQNMKNKSDNSSDIG